MKAKIILLLYLFVVTYFLEAKSQTLQQVGYYYVNGLFSVASKPGYMFPGDGSMVDVSVPASPAIYGNVSLAGIGTAVLSSGNYVYYGTGMNVNLHIADVSNVSFPIIVGTKSFPAFNGGIFGMAKSNDVLYLAMGDDGVYSVDISNKTNPVLLDSINFLTGQSRDLVVHGNFAFVANYDGLKILDITDPLNISSITSIGSGYNSIDMDTVNSLVFLGKNSGGVDVINVSSPFFPVPAFAIPNSGGTAWDLKYKDNMLYLATNSSGLFVYKITANSGIQMADFPNTSNGQSFAVALQDSLIFLTGLINGAAILKYDSTATTGIIEPKEDPFIIYPNPATDYIEFSKSNELIKEIEIVNSIGQIVLQLEHIDVDGRINVSALPAGNYFVYFRTDKKTLHRKIIVE